MILAEKDSKTCLKQDIDSIIKSQPRQGDLQNLNFGFVSFFTVGRKTWKGRSDKYNQELIIYRLKLRLTRRQIKR